MIDVINRVADAPDPTARIKVLVAELGRHLPQGNPVVNRLLDEMDEKAAFFASAIVSGGHVHDMSMRFEGKAAAG